MHIFCRQLVKKGQDELNDHKCKRDSDKRNQYGFAQELENELACARADGLADADLLGASLAAGRGQVHKVYTGQEKDEDADNTEKPNAPDKTAIGFAIFKVAPKMSPVERIDQGVLMIIFDMRTRHMANPGGGLLGRNAGRQFHIKTAVMIFPVRIGVTVTIDLVVPG